ncbi:Fe-S cluster assembly sulfur transfer protein SufU [Chondrinema litorale]|uniref:Fe-S cluster assembly sulfur transfer protein SufU n=1 Tax=Chondrinema litorale TaxID=2994555 RepID=UPI002542FC43|nr:SUF system NifU family Fe-S cluster assembly protein [Chondrinema litorale]UZR97863.1 SUF system NifU family Fe-S cluster assembly protein [Chondrinema litorale]
MSNQLNSLYHEVIKKHNKEPYHFEKVPTATLSLRANNPICGDRFDLFIDADKDILDDLHFHGFGCAISKASSSIMIQTLEGKSYEEAIDICSNFLAYIHNELEGEVYSVDFEAFEALQTQTARLDCAALSWKTMLEFLKQKTKQQ